MHKNVVIHDRLPAALSKVPQVRKTKSKIHAHNPPCIAAVKGDTVTIHECRPLSKTVSCVVVEKKGGV
jgi:small subunit ribosomal protein S17